jgi:hypothetical protein
MGDALDTFLRRPRRLAIAATALLGAALFAAGWSLWSRSSPAPASSEPISQGPTADRPNGLSGPGRRGPSPSELLLIESLQVVLRRRAADDPEGPVGINVFAARMNQDARVQVRLNRLAYCFLIALNPDGSHQLCYPKKAMVAPPATTAIDYPSDAGSGYGLTDGAGTQAFVLVASLKPLPKYAVWSFPRFDELPWKPVPDAGVWRYDGRSFDHDAERGEVRPLADLPAPLEATCRLLQAGPGIEAIRAVAFPVRSHEKVKSHERTG